MALNYYRIDHKVFNLDDKTECFFMVCDGNGMVNSGIHDKDLLLFKLTDNPAIGSIVAAEVDGQVMCRRYIKNGSDIILRRENNQSPDIVLKRCKFKGELVSLIRNFG